MESNKVKAALIFYVLFPLWIVAKRFLSEVNPVIVKPTKEKIRQETEVPELHSAEDRCSISQLPNGVFGYADPLRLDRGWVGGVQRPNTTIASQTRKQLAF